MEQRLFTNEMNRRKFLQLLGLAGAIPVAGSLLAACGDDDDDDAPAAPGTTPAPDDDEDEDDDEDDEPADEPADDEEVGGEIIIGLDSEPPTMDPHGSPSAITFQMMSSVTESLLYLDPDRSLQPSLATEWEVQDEARSYVFTLREDVYFHDGEYLTAETIQQNFDRIVDPNYAAGSALGALEGYAGCEILDEYTVQVNFEQSYAPFLTNAAGASLGIVSPAAVEELGDAFGDTPVGSGPFKVESYTRQQNVVLVRNAEYNRQAPYSDREGAPLVERLEFRFIPESSTRVTTVETGETQMINVVPSQDLPRLDADENIEIASVPWPGIPRILMLNTQMPPTDEVEVRQAINYAIDRQALADTIFAGTAEPARAALTAVMLEDPSLELPYDPDRARELLEEAGWEEGSGGVRTKNGQRLTFLMNVIDTGSDMIAEFIQANLIDIGFDVELRVQARAPWYEDNYNCATNGPIMFLRSSDYDGLFAMFHSSRIGENFGFACLQNDEIDEMLEEGQRMTDSDARRDHYLEVLHRIREVAPAAPLVDELSVWAHHASIQGFKFSGTAYPVFGDIRITS
jgi:peptide/nickel transport system substrate-binding protein